VALGVIAERFPSNGDRSRIEPSRPHPDQCLRIYWYVDEDDRIFVVGHIGRHL